MKYICNILTCLALASIATGVTAKDKATVTTQTKTKTKKHTKSNKRIHHKKRTLTSSEQKQKSAWDRLALRRRPHVSAELGMNNFELGEAQKGDFSYKIDYGVRLSAYLARTIHVFVLADNNSDEKMHYDIGIGYATYNPYYSPFVDVYLNNFKAKVEDGGKRKYDVHYDLGVRFQEGRPLSYRVELDDLFTKRASIGLGLNYLFSPHWSVELSVYHLVYKKEDEKGFSSSKMSAQLGISYIFV